MLDFDLGLAQGTVKQHFVMVTGKEGGKAFKFTVENITIVNDIRNFLVLKSQSDIKTVNRSINRNECHNCMVYSTNTIIYVT